MLKYEIIPLGPGEHDFEIGSYRIARYWVYIEVTAVNELRVRVWDNIDDADSANMRDGRFVFDWFVKTDFELTFALTSVILMIMGDKMREGYHRVVPSQFLNFLVLFLEKPLFCSWHLKVMEMHRYNSDRKNKPPYLTIEQDPGGHGIVLIPSKTNV